MKQTSSTTDSNEYAVCSFSVPRYSAAQRARIIAPRLGTEPIPAAQANSTQSGPVRCAASSRPAAAARATRVAGRSTRRCPCRSTSREICGPITAADSAMVADSAPASPYRPVSWETIVTTPMPIIDSGIRPRNPAAENALVPGSANRAL